MRVFSQEFKDSILQNKMVLFCLIVFVLLVLICWFGPLLSPYDFEQIDWDNMSIPPNFSNQHYFGTDAIGRDLYVRTLEGGQISILVGLIASLVSLFIGVSYGSVAGYVGGKTDLVMMRIVDVLYALPFMFIVLLIMVVFGNHMHLVFLTIGAYLWLDMARIVRGQTLQIKQNEYVLAAQAMGAKPIYIIRKHIIPNLMGIVIVYLTLTIPQVILIESFLSFLGLGIQEPSTSWGALVNEGALDMEVAPWSLIFPASFLAICLFCLNFIGDGLRDIFDPKGQN